MSIPASVRMAAKCISLGGGITVEPRELLGRGSLATVHRAWYRTRSGVVHPVALKLFGGLATEERDRVIEAVLEAAKRSACVNHRNVASLYDAGVLDGLRPFYVRELIDGTSLRSLLDALTADRTRLSVAAALHIGVEVADALAAARRTHGADGRPLGLVHGDLSPRKVFVTDSGDVKVTDFGLGAVRNVASSVQSMKQIAARVVSSAPEVVAGDPADSRSDVFSLALLVREMLLGPRFVTNVKDSEVVEWARQGLTESAAPSRELPTELVRVLEGALRVDPQDRYPNAAVFAFELRRLVELIGVKDGRAALRRAYSQFFEDAGCEDASSTLVEHGTPVSPPFVSAVRPVAKDDQTDRDVFSSLQGVGGRK